MSLNEARLQAGVQMGQRILLRLVQRRSQPAKVKAMPQYGRLT
jgi:hypothetical protein